MSDSSPLHQSDSHHPAHYAGAGVNIQAGDALVDAIKPAAQATMRPGVMGGIGGFGALFDLKSAGFSDPVLVSCTDGVGTKLLLAVETGLHDTIGTDLVAMCVNDLVVQGAQPLFFLDYLATGRLSLPVAQRIIEGIAKACRETGCALVGGETAEMPGLYKSGHYDLAGFSVGAAERSRLLPSGIRPGDSLIGLPSSGVHSNGFSLVRHIIGKHNLTWDEKAEFAPELSLAKALLTPTRLYVRPAMELHHKGLLHGCAHITGGGLPGNLPRILPPGLGAVVHGASWPVLPVFRWLAKNGPISDEEMLNVFNCGIGMVLITPEPDHVRAELAAMGEDSFLIGKIVESDQAFSLENPVSFL